MVLAIIIAVCFGMVVGFLFAYQHNPKRILDVPLDRIETTRRIARDKGLVLHKDSYLNGVELYVPESYQKLPYDKVKMVGLRI